MSIGVLGLNTLSLNLHRLNFYRTPRKDQKQSDQVVMVPFVELLAKEIGWCESPIVQLES